MKKTPTKIGSKGSAKTNNSRRKLLIGGGVVASAAAWQTPVLKSVILPAHAQMSMAEANFFGSASVANVGKNHSPLDYLISPAYAGGETEGMIEYTVVIARVGEPGTMYDIGVHTRSPGFELELSSIELLEFVFRDTIGIGTQEFLPIEENPCMVRTKGLPVEIVSDNGDSIDILLPGELPLNVPQAEGSLPIAQCVIAAASSYFTESASEIFQETSLDSSEFSPLDLLVKPAHAQLQMSNDGFAVERNGAELTVTHRNRNRTVLRRGTLPVTGLSDGTLSVVTNNCDGGGSDITMSLDSIDETEMVLRMVFNGERGTRYFVIPAAAIGDLPLETICPN